MGFNLRRLVSASFVLASLAVGTSAFAMRSPLKGARSLPSLTDAQRAKLDEAARQEETTRAQLHTALAAQVERGKVDRSAIAPQLAAEKQREENARRVVDATLTAEQKAELARHRQAHREHRKEHGGADGGAPKHGRGPAEGLNLSPEQREQIRARMAAERSQRSASDRGAEKMVDRIEAMTPILTPAQRAELAAKLRK